MPTYPFSIRALGCQVNVWLETAGDGRTLLQPVPEWLEMIEASLSRFRATSELSRLNARIGDWVPVSPVLFAALSAARRAAQWTAGLVTPLILPALVQAGYDRSFELLPAAPAHRDPANAPAVAHWEAIELDATNQRVRLPGPIDLGGTAKGWAAAEIADMLDEHGPVLVDLGGDIVARGKPWPVEIADPFQPETAFTTLALENCAVATSGTDYRRWNMATGAPAHHIIDPRTGMPAASDAVSVTVVHPDAVLAEAAAKVGLLRGTQAGLAWLAAHSPTAGLTFDQHGRVLATDNILHYFVQTEGA